MKVKLPSYIQKFDEQEIDLSQDEAMYQRFLSLTASAQDPKTGENALQVINGLKTRSLFKDLSTEDKGVLINSTINNFEKIAKEKLRQEYPVIDQLVLDATLKQNNEGPL
jgi:hypothetical protein